MAVGSRMAELIAPERAEELQCQLAAATGGDALLLDPQGRPLSPPDGWEDTPALRELVHAARRSGSVQVEGACLAVPVPDGRTLACIWRLQRPEGWPSPLRETVAGLAQAFTLGLIHAEGDRAGAQRTAAEASRLVFADPLCGLPNDRQLERDLAANRSWRYLLLVDVADLRGINSVHGHEYGDELLRQLSAYLHSICPEGAQLYRLNRADFAMLFQRGYNNAVAQQIGEALAQRCRQPWALRRRGRQTEVAVTVNVGAVEVGGLVDAGYHNVTSAIEYTLAQARRRGGVALPDGTGDRSYQAHVRLELDLRGAVREGMGGFSLDWQPLADPGVAKWRGLEALCRWESESIGPVSPAEFIPIAESTGLIGALGDWVLDQALGQVRGWELDRQEGFLLVVNLSPVQLGEPDLPRRVKELLERHDYPPHRLCLEITRSESLCFSPHLLEALERLRAVGVSLSLDDFAGSFTALKMLQSLPVVMLKTDLSAAREPAEDTRQLFGGVVELAHSAGMQVVAKGIETDSQARMALGQGADLIQGYRFGRPLDSAGMQQRLNNFLHPLGELVELGYARMDLSRLSDEQGGYNLTPALHKLLNRCMRELFFNPDGNTAIHTALERIGRALRVSRSYVFIKEEDGTFSNTHEWCAPGIRPERDTLQHAPIMELSPGWLNALARDGLLVAPDINLLEEGARQALGVQGIKAVAEFPIWKEEELYGFVGFDDCRRNHVWTREEVQMLHTLTGIITAVLGKLELQEQLRGEGRRLENMLNAMDTAIYVSDLETNRILFANHTLQKMFPQPLEGRICWEVLQNRQDRCEFCPIPYLLDNPGKSYQWEHYNEVLGGYFRSRDSIIPWEGGRMVHFEYAENITEHKRYQSQLETVASTDMLTGVLNRSAFELETQRRVEQAMEQGDVLTVAFVDIDHLKRANDLYGHAAGDRLILDVVRVLQNNVRSTDQIGRYGGDEFVVLFGGCDLEAASARVRQAAWELEEMMGGSELGYGFSYGLASNREVRGGPGELISAMLSLADQRMMAQKRTRKGHRGNEGR